MPKTNTATSPQGHLPMLSRWDLVPSLSVGQEKEAKAQSPLPVGRLRKDLHIEIKNLGP